MYYTISHLLRSNVSSAAESYLIGLPIDCNTFICKHCFLPAESTKTSIKMLPTVIYVIYISIIYYKSMQSSTGIYYVSSLQLKLKAASWLDMNTVSIFYHLKFVANSVTLPLASRIHICRGKIQ